MNDEYKSIDKHGRDRKTITTWNEKPEVHPHKDPAEKLKDLMSQAIHIQNQIQIVMNELIGPSEPSEEYAARWKELWEKDPPRWNFGYEDDMVLELEDDTHFWKQDRRYHLSGYHLHPEHARVGMRLVVVMENQDFMRLVVESYCGMDTENPYVVLNKIEDMKDSGLYVCGNCGRIDKEDQLPDAKDLSQRMLPGDTYTDKECPSCGSLSFPLKQAKEDV